MDARRGYRSRTAHSLRVYYKGGEGEKSWKQVGEEDGCRRRGSREERVWALGRRRCTSSLPVQLYLQQRYLSHKQGGEAAVFSSRWSSDTMPLQSHVRVYTRLYARRCYIYIYSFANYRRAMPTQFNLNFDARGGWWLAGGSGDSQCARAPATKSPEINASY